MEYNKNTDFDTSTTNTMNQRTVIHALFQDPGVAANAVGALIDIGVRNTDVSLTIKDAPAGWDPNLSGTDLMNKAEHGITTTTGHDAGVGAVKGTGIGLGLGALAALAAITLPGVGLIIGGGALAGALGATAAAAGAGAVSGGVYGYLKDQGTDDTVAVRADSDFQEGGALVSVTTPSENISAELVQQTLNKYQDHWYLVSQRDEYDMRQPDGEARIYTYPSKRTL